MAPPNLGEHMAHLWGDREKKAIVIHGSRKDDRYFRPYLETMINENMWPDENRHIAFCSECKAVFMKPPMHVDDGEISFECPCGSGIVIAISYFDLAPMLVKKRSKDNPDFVCINTCLCKEPKKTYSESGCTSCWHCAECGKFGGCDNQVFDY